MIPMNPSAPFFTDDEMDALVAALCCFDETPLPDGIPKKQQRLIRRIVRDLLSQLDSEETIQDDYDSLLVMADAVNLYASMLAQAAALEPLPAEMEQHRLFLPALRQKIEPRLDASTDT